MEQRQDGTMQIFAAEILAVSGCINAIVARLDHGDVRVQTLAAEVLTGLLRQDGPTSAPLAITAGAVPELTLNLKVGHRIKSGAWRGHANQQQYAPKLLEATSLALAELAPAFRAATDAASAAPEAVAAAASGAAAETTPAKKKRGGRQKLPSAERKRRRKETNARAYKKKSKRKLAHCNAGH